MTCSGTLGKTTTLSDGTSVIGYVHELTPNEITVDSIDTTTYGDSEWKEFCPGLKDGGSLTISVYKVDNDASLNRMIQRAIGDASLNTDTYTLTFPDSETMIFTGSITNMPVETPIDDYITVSFTIKVSGAVTGTIGT
jgi:hypothetical protein